MIHSLFGHCCAVWDSCGKTDRDYQTGCIYEHLISLTGVNKKILTGSTFSWPSLENCKGAKAWNNFINYKT